MSIEQVRRGDRVLFFCGPFGYGRKIGAVMSVHAQFPREKGSVSVALEGEAPGTHWVIIEADRLISKLT